MINGKPLTNKIWVYNTHPSSQMDQLMYYRGEKERGERFTFPRAIRGPSKNMITPSIMNNAPNDVNPT